MPNLIARLPCCEGHTLGSGKASASLSAAHTGIQKRLGLRVGPVWA